jgi:hypothetical protein
LPVQSPSSSCGWLAVVVALTFGIGAGKSMAIVGPPVTERWP